MQFTPEQAETGLKIVARLRELGAQKEVCDATVDMLLTIVAYPADEIMSRLEQTLKTVAKARIV